MAVEAPNKGLPYFTVGVKYVGLKYRFRSEQGLKIHD